jgi:CDP-diacylglycerol--glycerol-3-phosphate 3-phosphatidyltransferase
MSSLVSPGFRQRVRSGVEPIARLFGRVGLTPNALTLIGFGIAVVAAYAAATQAWLAAGLLVAFGAVFDLFDGALARATNKTSRFGAFMDSTFDRAGEAVVYIGLIISLYHIGVLSGPVLAASAMASAFMVSYVRAKSESLGFAPGTGMASVGLAPREVRVVILSVGLIVAGLTVGPPQLVVPYFWWTALVTSLALIAILATVTTIQRIFFVYRQSKSQEDNV